MTPGVGLMNERDEYSDELLSAYLDGELTVSQRQEVEGWLSESSEHQQQLEELRRLSDQLNALPTYRLSPVVTDRILAAVNSRAASAGAMDPANVSDELLGAYVDGEATDQERELVESALIASEHHRQVLGDLEDLQGNLATLQRHPLDEGFAERVLAQIDRELPTSSATTPQIAEEAAERVAPAEPRKSGSGWRRTIWAAVVVAAAVVLMVVFHGMPENTTTPNGPPDIAHEDSPRIPETLPGTDEPPAVAHDDPRRREDPVLQTVNTIRKNRGHRLILVYEVLVTPEGVEKAAFANVFRRQGIRFQHTVPVPRDQRSDLLKERYLDNVKIVDSVEPDMDEIEMYLVSCTGRIADDLYFDLKRPPEGIGGFMLNLAVIDPDKGIMHRLCDAAKLQERSGEAIQLLANFAMLSSTTRNVGVFGRIEYVEPILLTSPKSTGESVDPDEQPAPEELGVPEGPDFPCELLFVVRNLRPVDALPAKK